MADEDGISFTAPPLIDGNGIPPDGNNTPTNSSSGEINGKSSKSRCKPCSESHLRCSILQTGYPCDYCRKNNLHCSPSLIFRKGVPFGTKRGPYKKTAKSNGAEETRSETTSNSSKTMAAAAEYARNEILPDLQKLKRNLETLNTVLDGTPCYKKPRYSQDVPFPAAPLESLANSSSILHPVSGITAISAPKNRFGKTLLPSYRGEFTYARGLPRVDNSFTNVSSEVTQTNGAGYERWNQRSGSDGDDDCDDDKEVFYDSSPIPASISATSMSAGHQFRSPIDSVSTTSASRAPDCMSSSAYTPGPASPQENNGANQSPTCGPEHTKNCSN